MQQDLTTTNILSLFQTDKGQRFSFARDVINRILAGDVDPLKIHVQLKCMEDIIKKILSDPCYKDSLLEETRKCGNHFKVYNGKFSIKEAAVKYDYSSCGDPVLPKLYLKKSEIDAEVKEREAFLRSIPQYGIEVISEDGEVCMVYPPPQSSTTTVAVTLS